jgi:large subunit ribosomal protein L10
VAITKQKKSEILAKLDEGMKSAETVVFVNFHGLSVADVTDLRRQMRAAGVTYYVAKKTLVKRALAARGVTGTLPETPGELALAWSTDPIAPAKGVASFIAEQKKRDPKKEPTVKIVGGVYQGAFISLMQVTALATVPPREVLLGQFVGLLNAPASKLVRVLHAPVSAFALVLGEKSRTGAA